MIRLTHLVRNYLRIKGTPATMIIMSLLLSVPKIQKYIENFTERKKHKILQKSNWLTQIFSQSGKWNVTIGKWKVKFFNTESEK